MLLIGLRDDGAFDTRFGAESTPGRLVLDLSPLADGNSMLGAARIDADGGLLLGATWFNQSNRSIAIVRLIDDLVFADSLEPAL